MHHGNHECDYDYGIRSGREREEAVYRYKGKIFSSMMHAFQTLSTRIFGILLNFSRFGIAFNIHEKMIRFYLFSKRQLIILLFE